VASPAQIELLQGFLHYRAREYSQAEQSFGNVLRMEPDSAPALAALGRLYLRMNRDAEAIEHLERAVKLAPQDAESHYQLGVLLDRNERTECAIAHLKRAIALRANYPDPRYAWAKIELREKRPHKALELLLEALQQAPEQVPIHLLLARTYRALGEEEKAKMHFAEVQRLQQTRLLKEEQALELLRP
jgi:Flp pilus assembly protein TadD